jgi:hypothetical protein
LILNNHTQKSVSVFLLFQRFVFHEQPDSCGTRPGTEAAADAFVAIDTVLILITITLLS